MWAGVIWLGLPSIDVEADVHLRHRLERLDQRVADQVGERDLAAAGAGQVVVDDDAVVPEQLDRHRRGPRSRSGPSASRPCWRRCGRGRRAARCRSAGRPPRPAPGPPSPWAPGGRCPWPARRPRVSGRGVACGAALASARLRRRFSARRRRVGAFAAGAAPAGRRVSGPAARVGVAAAGRARAGPARRVGAPFVPEPLVLKYAAQLGSTLPGSRWNWSYISSTSHSLAPKSEEGAARLESDGLVCCCGTGAFASSGTCAWMVGI